MHIFQKNIYRKRDAVRNNNYGRKFHFSLLSCFIYLFCINRTCHLAGELARHLQAQHSELIDDKDILCVEIAGLCHDLGNHFS